MSTPNLSRHSPQGDAGPTANLFETLRALSSATKDVTIANPDDVLGEVPEWSAEQAALPEEDRGKPQRVRLEIRPGATLTTVKIRRMSMAEREAAQKILDAAVPPRVFVEEPPDRPGLPPRKVAAGFDETDPEYLAALRPLEARQSAFVVLAGVVGLRDDTPGHQVETQIDAVMSAMDDRIIRYLASQIWSLSWSAGDHGDFFTSADSASSPSSAPTPRRSPREPKRK